MMTKLAAVALGLGVLLGAPALANAQVQPAEGTILFQKIDEHGRVVPGAEFDLQFCYSRDDEPWSCGPYDGDLSWFNGTDTPGSDGDQEPYRSLTKTGFSDAFTTWVPVRGGWSEPIELCLGIRETVAPTGYLPASVKASEPALVCRGPGGWTVENAINSATENRDAVSVTFAGDDTVYGPGLGAWTVVSTEDPFYTVFTLQNDPYPTTVQKVDADGELLAGATFEGESCVRWDEDTEWTCESLSEETLADLASGLTTLEATTEGRAFFSDEQFAAFQAQLEESGADHPYAETNVFVAPVDECVAIRETAAPDGYEAKSAPVVVCKSKTGWTTAYAEELGFVGHFDDAEVAPTLGDWVIDNVLDADGLAVSSSFPLSNVPVPASETPVPPVAPAPSASPTSVADQPALAATGAESLMPLAFIGLAIVASGALILRRRSAVQ